MMLTGRSGSVATVLTLTAICAIAFFWRLGACGIFDLDEGLYVAVAREMCLTGDFVTPRVNGQPFYEKPPAVYWSSALSMRAFGRSEFAARLPNALALTAVVAILYLFGSARFGRRAAFLAAAFFALSPLTLGAGRQLTMDAQLTLWFTAALLSAFVGLEAGGARRMPWLAAFWAVCGMAVLTKGVVGVILPCVIVAIYLALRRRGGHRVEITPMSALRFVCGLAVCLLIAVPWHVAAWKANGAPFVEEYIVKQHLQRFRGGDVAHLAPFWFFIPALFVGAIPWSGVLPAALLARRKRSAGGASDVAAGGAERPHVAAGAEGVPVVAPDAVVEPDVAAGTVGDVAPDVAAGAAAPGIEMPGYGYETRLRGLTANGDALRAWLKVWCVVVFLFFSASGSKLVSYILPLFPAAALLAGVWCSEMLDGEWRARPLTGGLAAAFAVAALLLAVLLVRDPLVALAERLSHKPVVIDADTRAMLAWGVRQIGLLTGVTGAALVLALCKRRGAAIGVMVAGMAAFAALAVVDGLGTIDGRLLRPLHGLARLAALDAKPNEPIVVAVGPPRRPSALFYLPDRCFTGGAPALETTDDDGTVQYLRTRRAIVLTQRDRADRLGLLPGAERLGERGRFVLLRVR